MGRAVKSHGPGQGNEEPRAVQIRAREVRAGTASVYTEFVNERVLVLAAQVTT